ncbi:unnamed protein product [Protopolystoma xenopodis]|uniref:Uncharacterized protein n=1 Tax=Protopolystoma xenopodis TaxID=117903 RepID=A0A3S5CDT5_9PLAT|nr:unnamed protein product [Protopolystoma xenopodis]
MLKPPGAVWPHNKFRLSKAFMALNHTAALSLYVFHPRTTRVVGSSSVRRGDKRTGEDPNCNSAQMSPLETSLLSAK